MASKNKNNISPKSDVVLRTIYEWGYMETKEISWEEFQTLAKGLVKKIEKNYYDWSKYGILGISRGGLPLLTFVANQLGVHDVYTAKVQATNSDKAGDLSKETQVLHADLGDKQRFIVLDDVISTGKSISRLFTYMLKRNCNLEKAFCLYGDEDVERQTGVEIETEKWKKRDEWTIFPWEKK